MAIAFATLQARADPVANSAHSHRKSAAKTVAASDQDTGGNVPNFTTVPNFTVKPGVESRLEVAWDCTHPDWGPAVWARADHGTVTIRTVTGPSCGLQSMTLSGVFYRPEPGFKGLDTLYVLGYLTNGKIDEQSSILVK